MRIKLSTFIVSSVKAIIVFTICMTAVYFNTSYLIRYDFKKSKSLDKSLFFGKKHFNPNDISVGDYVGFQCKNIGHTTKKVIGNAGSKIEIYDGVIFVDGNQVGEVKRLSPSGKTYTPISEKYVGVGKLFVSGTNENSFDSCYKEFGLVNVDDVEEVLWPLL